MFVHNDTLGSQGAVNPLQLLVLVPVEPGATGRTPFRIIYLAPFFLVGVGVCDANKVSKKRFCHGVDGVGCRALIVELSMIRGDVEA